MEELVPDAILRHVGLRVTRQRSVVLQALMALPHPDVAAIYGCARQHHPTLSLATVYNVLDTLRAVGLVAILEYRGRRHFDVRIDRHDHIRCRRCGLVADVVRHPLTRVERPPSSTWIIEGQAMVWEGLCPSCQTV